MSSVLSDVAVAFGLGMLSAGAYFAALWGAVRRLTRTTPTLPRLLGGAGLRIGLLVGSYWLVSGGAGERIALAVLGFLVVRTAVLGCCTAGSAPAQSQPEQAAP